jgi:cellulose synthase/poly-beta-1,6-N-acetylglucosamine synthase-like glycosyltransferase
MASLTEDGEITLALKTLGFRCVSPGGCAVTTEIMSTLPSWWKQRTRWQRGALEDLRAYGMTRVTLPYVLRQFGMGASVAVFALYVVYSLVTTCLYGYHTNALWLSISALFVAERVLTVRRAGWREIVTASLIFPELVYDALQHAVWLWCVTGALLRTRTDW